MTPFTYEIDFTLFVAPESVEESKPDGNHQPQYKPANIRGRSMNSESELLVCPDCGNGRFSWIIRQVQFGAVHRFANGHIDVEGTKNGPITDSDIGENGVFCVDCQEFRTYLSLRRESRRSRRE